MKEIRGKAKVVWAAPARRRRGGWGATVALGRLAGILLLAGGAVGAAALEPSTTLANYGRQGWGMENGLPQNTVQALGQTRDGFVWLGTEAGLVRFDGNSFQVFDRNTPLGQGGPALPGNDVRCLLATGDGALWIGTGDGLARWKDGAARIFTTKDGLPASGVRALSVKEGVVLATTDAGEASVNGDRVTPAIDAMSTSIDPRLEPIFAARIADGSRAQGTKTEATVFGAGRELRWRVGHELPGTRVLALYGDREGALWIGTNGGLVRYAAGRLQRFPVTDALASASVLAVMEDSEGDLWVGTEADGLQILRDQRFRTIGVREGLSSEQTTAVVEDGAGTIWAGTGGGGLNAIHLSGGGGEGGVEHFSVRNGLLSDVVLSLAAAANGDLWVGTPDGLNRIRGGRVTGFTSADGLPDDFVRSLLVDGDGSLWMGTRRGLTHWRRPGTTPGAAGAAGAAAGMETYTQTDGLGSDLVGAMTRDAKGDLWVATLAGLSRLHAGKMENYTRTNGLSSNVITALLARRNGTLLIGTQDHGWTIWNGKSFDIAESFAENMTSIHAILDDDAGHLWFATGNGVARCDWIGAKGGADCAHWLEFGPADGLKSRETATNSHPSAWRASDGRLWFATPKGLVVVDPAHFPVNGVAPPVVLERFAVDDAAEPAVAAGAVARIPAGHVHFEFDYAGLSFVGPQKVRYRYMLEGFDRGWTDAGGRRAAYYTNIPPGRYTFRVQAANNDGTWNEAGAALRFELRPHYYQTLWFYGLLLVAGAALVGLAVRQRLRRAESQFSAVLGERSRIAREIHDTLAQGYVGISVQLEVLAELLRQNRTAEAARQLDTARGHVREGLKDARESIWALRSQEAGETTLPVRMRRLVEAAGGGDVEARFGIHGAYRALAAETEREILRVGQEAIQNVKSHARARHLFVQLEYRPEEIALEVRDDGRGFPVEEMEGAAGHYGLTGMRERAELMGGALEVRSEPGAGTTVRLRAPARAKPE